MRFAQFAACIANRRAEMLFSCVGTERLLCKKPTAHMAEQHLIKPEEQKYLANAREHLHGYLFYSLSITYMFVCTS